jgi:hypothetical protein
MKRLISGLVILSLGLFTFGCGGDAKAPAKKPEAGKTAPAAPAEKPADKK